jgi:formate dehydrogenase subunit gamma
MQQSRGHRDRAPWDRDVALRLIREHLAREGPLLPILHALQEEFGYIDTAAEPLIAEALNITRAEVHGVITFYHDFRREPAGRHVLKLCRAEACQSAGGDPLAARAEARLGLKMGATAPDGSVTLEPVYCLGLCATAPSAMLDGRVVGGSTPTASTPCWRRRSNDAAAVHTGRCRGFGGRCRRGDDRTARRRRAAERRG